MDWRVAIAVALIGSGGAVVAWRRARSDHRLGISGDERAGLQAVIETQTKDLIAPLRTELSELRGEVRELRAEVAAVRTLYWRALEYIRVIRRWAHDRHVGPVPDPPTDIADDI